MKKLLLLTFFSVLIFSSLFYTPVNAASVRGQPPEDPSVVHGTPPKTDTTTTGTLQNPLQIDSIGKLINTLLDVFAYVAVLLAVGALIWVGFKFILARGNPAKTKDASIWLGYIVIGIAIILGARLIISVVLGTLEATGVVKSDVIQSANNALNGQ